MITISDGTTSVEWTGVWVHAKSQFQHDRDRNTPQQVVWLAEKGLTHIYGSEAAAKGNAAEAKAGKEKRAFTSADKEAVIAAAREAYREAMYEQKWTPGTRAASAGSGDPLKDLVEVVLVERTRTAVGALQKIKKDGVEYWLDGDNQPYPLETWVQVFRSDDRPSEDADYEGKTLGEEREAKAMLEAEARMAEKLRRAAQRAADKSNVIKMPARIG